MITRTQHSNGTVNDKNHQLKIATVSKFIIVSLVLWCVKKFIIASIADRFCLFVCYTSVQYKFVTLLERIGFHTGSHPIPNQLFNESIIVVERTAVYCDQKFIIFKRKLRLDSCNDVPRRRRYSAKTKHSFAIDKYCGEPRANVDGN